MRRIRRYYRRGEEDKEEGEEEDKAELAIPTLNDALKTKGIVNRFYKFGAGNKNIVSQIIDTEEHLQNWYRSSLRIQETVVDCLRLTPECEHRLHVLYVHLMILLL